MSSDIQENKGLIREEEGAESTLPKSETESNHTNDEITDIKTSKSSTDPKCQKQQLDSDEHPSASSAIHTRDDPSNSDTVDDPNLGEQENITSHDVKGKGVISSERKSFDLGEQQPHIDQHALGSTNSNSSINENKTGASKPDEKKLGSSKMALAITEDYIAQHAYDEPSEDDDEGLEYASDSESEENLASVNDELDIEASSTAQSETSSKNTSVKSHNQKIDNREANQEESGEEVDESDGSYMEYNYSHVDQETDSLAHQLGRFAANSGNSTAKAALKSNISPISSPQIEGSSNIYGGSSDIGSSATLSSLSSNHSKLSPAAAKLRSNQATPSSSKNKRSISGVSIPFGMFGKSSSDSRKPSSNKPVDEADSSVGTKISGATAFIESGIESLTNNLSINSISNFGSKYLGIPEFSKKKASSSSSRDNGAKKSQATSLSEPESGSSESSSRPSLPHSLSISHLEDMASMPSDESSVTALSGNMHSSPTTALSFDTGFGSSGFNVLDTEIMLGSTIIDYQNDSSSNNFYDNNDEVDGYTTNTAQNELSTLETNQIPNNEIGSTKNNELLDLPSPHLTPIATTSPSEIVVTDVSGITSTSGLISETGSMPPLDIEPGSEAATILSEVLDSDMDVSNVFSAHNSSRGSAQSSVHGSTQNSIYEPGNSSHWNSTSGLSQIGGYAEPNLELEVPIDTHTDAGLEYPSSLSPELSITSDSDSDNYDDYDNHIIDGPQESEYNNGDDDDNTSRDVSEEARAIREEQELSRFLARKKQYFILSTAGKPIYSMYGSDELITGYMGVFQAIVSYFEDDTQSNSNEPAPDNRGKGQVASQKEGLRFLRAGNTIFVFALEDPLILIAVDKLGQTESQLRSQLDLLYTQILSTLTKSQLSKVFRGRTNFDLRPMLAGTEVFLNALTSEMSFGSPGILLGSLECLRLRKSVRAKMHTILSERRTKSLLYGMIVADSRLVAVIRPRRHSLHPPDLHLIFSMIFNTHSFSKGRGEHWVPICLPKFNATGFLYAYIHFFAPPQVALVLISADKNSFFELQAAKEQIVGDLETYNLISPITNSLKRGRYRTIEILGTPHLSSNLATAVAESSRGLITGVGRGRVSISARGGFHSSSTQQQGLPSQPSIPASLLLAPFTIRHFLYKSKQNVQFVMPSFDPHYMDARSRHKLMVLYHQLHGALHAGGSLNSGGGSTGLRVYHVSRGKRGVEGSALSWITPTFELYCVTGSAHEAIHIPEEDGAGNQGDESNDATRQQFNTAANLVAANINNKDAMLRAVKAIVNWIKLHEERLFIFGGSVF